MSKVPSYCLHRASGRAYCRIGRQPVYLGKHGSPESHAEYERVLAEWRAGHAPTGPCRTVEELVNRFRVYADRHYRHADGTPKSELENYRKALRPVLRLYGHTSVRDFGPRALKAIQRALMDGSWMGEAERKAARKPGWSRGWINRTCNRIKTFVAWCESEELLPAGTAGAFRTVHPLPPDSPGVRDMPDVPPVPERDLALTIAELIPVPRAIVETLLLTGARPGELLQLRPCDINRTGRVEVARNYFVTLGSGLWAYQPAKHKTAYRGHRRVILFGPKAQAILAPYLLGRDAGAFLFSPAESVERSRDARRKRPIRGRKPAPKRKPGVRYDTTALGHAIAKAVARADRKDREAGGPGVTPWHTYQLRHNAATRLVEQFGWEVARAVLGHRTLQMTATYAIENLHKVAEAMNKTG